MKTCWMCRCVHVRLHNACALCSFRQIAWLVKVFPSVSFRTQYKRSDLASCHRPKLAYPISTWLRTSRGRNVADSCLRRSAGWNACRIHSIPDRGENLAYARREAFASFQRVRRIVVSFVSRPRTGVLSEGEIMSEPETFQR